MGGMKTKHFFELLVCVAVVAVALLLNSVPVRAEFIAWEWHFSEDECIFESCTASGAGIISAHEMFLLNLPEPLECSYGRGYVRHHSTNYEAGGDMYVYMENSRMALVDDGEYNTFNFLGARPTSWVYLGNSNDDALEVYNLIFVCEQPTVELEDGNFIDKKVDFGAGGMMLAQLFTAGVSLLGIFLNVGKRLTAR